MFCILVLDWHHDRKIRYMHLVRIHACVTEKIAQRLSRVTLQEIQLEASHPVDSSVRVYKDVSYI